MGQKEKSPVATGQGNKDKAKSTKKRQRIVIFLPVNIRLNNTLVLERGLA